MRPEAYGFTVFQPSETRPPLEAGKKHGPRLSILAQPVVYKEMIFIQRHQSAGFTWIMICLIFGNFASISS